MFKDRFNTLRDRREPPPLTPPPLTPPPSLLDCKPGDLVCLKSGGRSMTVVDRAAGYVDCVWFDPEGHLQERTFPTEALSEQMPF